MSTLYAYIKHACVIGTYLCIYVCICIMYNRNLYRINRKFYYIINTGINTKINVIVQVSHRSELFRIFNVKHVITSERINVYEFKWAD